MGKNFDLSPVEVGEELPAYCLVPFDRGKVIAVHDDGTFDMERRVRGRFIEDEAGGEWVELGGGDAGDFVTMPFRARQLDLADGRRLCVVMDPSEYQS